MSSVKNYMTSEFTVMSREDYNRFMSVEGFDYKRYTARLFKNGDVHIDDKKYTNYMFNKLYTMCLC